MSGDNGKWSTFRQVLLFLLMCCFCSGETPQTAAPESSAGIEGVISVGPTHGGPTRIGVPDSKPLANATFVVESEKGSVAASFTTDGQGHFRISLPPGRYIVSLKDQKPKVGRYGPFDVNVVPNQTKKVEWSCDSGMR
jgi:Prealbumin-like fold domain